MITASRHQMNPRLLSTYDTTYHSSNYFRSVIFSVLSVRTLSRFAGQTKAQADEVLYTRSVRHRRLTIHIPLDIAACFVVKSLSTSCFAFKCREHILYSGSAQYTEVSRYTHYSARFPSKSVYWVT